MAETCAICRESLNDSCVSCRNGSKYDAASCITIQSRCKHEYHLHCIEEWLKHREVCPLDNKHWKFQKSNQIVKSLMNLCCDFLAKRADLVLEIMMDSKRIEGVTADNWKRINAKCSSNVVTPSWLTQDQRQIIGKMFKCYVPIKTKNKL